MQCVFVAGSRAVSKLTAQLKDRLDNIVKQNFTVLVGDANGADKAVQRYLAEQNYRRVIVYCMDACRNNIGNWPTSAHTAEPGVARDRHYYGVKDLAMARDASCGFMIWDGISKGTLANVINLVKAEKKVLLYSTRKKHFFTVRTEKDLHETLAANGVTDTGALLRSLASKKAELDQSELTFRS